MRPVVLGHLMLGKWMGGILYSNEMERRFSRS